MFPKLTLSQITRSGCIAALYALLAYFTPWFSFGIVQFRLSEALVLLPLHWPEAIPALAIGCFLANLSSPFGIIDIIFGTLCTWCAAWLTYKFRQRYYLAILAPIIVNAIGVSAYLAYLSKELYFAVLPGIALSEAAVVFALAIPIERLVQRTMKQG